MSEFRQIIEKINSLDTDEELKEYVRQRIDYLEKNSKTRKLSNMNMNGDKSQYGTNIEGYINSDSPIETSKMVDPFYIDDFNLYFDFAKQIKSAMQNRGADYSNLIDIFYEFSFFTESLFGYKGNFNNREKVYLVEREGNISIADFYHNDSALCSERSATVHNIATFFGLKSYLIFGELVAGDKTDTHAYNIIQAVDGTLILYDSTNPVHLESGEKMIKVPAFSIIGKQNIDDIEEVDFDFKTLSTVWNMPISEKEKPRKYQTYKYKLNKQK